MSQVTLEFSNNGDLTLLLSLAKRLNAHVVSVKTDQTEYKKDSRLLLMQQAAKDPLFLADILAVSADFKYIDNELHD